MNESRSASAKACWAVIVTFERPVMLQQCVGRILAQRDPVDGIVVVNNGTPLNGEAFLPAARERMVLIEGQGNVGPARGFAIGMRAAVDAGAELVWVMNDDDMPARNDSLGRLRLTLRTLEDAGQRVALLGCWVRLLRSDGSSCVSSRGANWQGCVLPLGPDSDPSQPHEVQVTTFSGAIVSAAFIREVGLPTGELFMQMEEFEYCLRSRGTGWSIWVTPEVLMIVRAIGSVEDAPPWRRYYQLRNAILLRRQYGRQHRIRFWLGALRRLLYAVLKADRKMHRLWLQWRGLRDGLQGRTGKLVPPEG